MPSHPAWVCGLKLLSIYPSSIYIASHPAWVCGLKQIFITFAPHMAVTPCVGVWIETSIINHANY